MKIRADSPSALTALDRPNSYIGRSVPRPNLPRLTQGRAQYVSDVVLPRMGHVAFVRSPHAHADIKSIDTAAARKAPGVGKSRRFPAQRPALARNTAERPSICTRPSRRGNLPGRENRVEPWPSERYSSSTIRRRSGTC